VGNLAGNSTDNLLVAQARAVYSSPCIPRFDSLDLPCFSTDKPTFFRTRQSTLLAANPGSNQHQSKKPRQLSGESKRSRWVFRCQGNDRCATGFVTPWVSPERRPGSRCTRRSLDRPSENVPSCSKMFHRLPSKILQSLCGAAKSHPSHYAGNRRCK
jgi:hypothetical protein